MDPMGVFWGGCHFVFVGSCQATEKDIQKAAVDAQLDGFIDQQAKGYDAGTTPFTPPGLHRLEMVGMK